MSNKRNPYATAESVGRWIVTILGIVAVLTVFIGLPILGIVIQQWELVWVPWAIGGGYAALIIAVHLLTDRWDRAKAKWDRRGND